VYENNPLVNGHGLEVRMEFGTGNYLGYRVANK